MEERPTRDLAAYNLYAEATCLIDAAPYEESEEPKKEYLRAVELLNQAIARDPAFLLAYCRLAEADDELYFDSFDRTSRRLELAKSAINSAFRLQPDSPEAHVAMAHHLYHCYFDYDRARDELEMARRSLPNEARIFDWSGLIDRRQNRWHDSIRNLNRAVDLDPQNPKILADLERTYWLLRDYKKADELHNRIAALKPTADPEMENAWRDVVERADTRALHAVLKSKAPDDQGFVDDRFQLALYERDAVAAKRELPAVVAHPGDCDDLRGVGSARLNRDYLEGLIARIRGDTAGAQVAFNAARAKQEESYRAHPEVQSNLCVLGLIDAGLGQKEEALREGRRAVDLAVPEKEALDAADVVYYYAVICGWVGERHLAIEQLQTSAKMPGGVNYMEIRLDPHWDPLRSDPRFEKIVVSLAPKRPE
jgi:tetratricopeptide (TPR) repeat protein